MLSPLNALFAFHPFTLLMKKKFTPFPCKPKASNLGAFSEVERINQHSNDG
jgi:hypothetical protein